MFSFDIKNFITGKSEKRVLKFIKEVRKIQHLQTSREASTYYVQKVGLKAMSIYNEQYYQNVVDYQLGLLLAHTTAHAEAAALIDSSQILPSDGGQQLFTDHQHASLDIHRKQERAKSNNMPTILLTSLPKSGSASLSQTLAALMNAPIVRVSAGDFVLIPSWLQLSCSGGTVTHDHFTATPHNIDTLKACGITKLCVQIRDPRAAVFSFFRSQVKRRMPDYVLDNFSRKMWEIYPTYVAWIANWIQAEESCDWLTIHWIYYKDYASSPPCVINNIFNFIGTSQLIEALVNDKLSLVDANFQQGDDNAWRDAVDKKTQERMWKQLPQSVIEKLHLIP